MDHGRRRRGRSREVLGQVTPLLAAMTMIAACSARSSTDLPAAQREEGLAQFRRELESMIPNASEGQRAVLEDGVVSRSEADRLAAEVIECGQQQGVEIRAAWKTDEGQMQFTVRTDNGDEPVAVYRDCWGRLYDVAERALALQNSLTGAQAAELEAGMIDCLRWAGITIGRWPSSDAPPAEAESTCYDEVYPTIAGAGFRLSP